MRVKRGNPSIVRLIEEYYTAFDNNIDDVIYAFSLPYVAGYCYAALHNNK